MPKVKRVDTTEQYHRVRIRDPRGFEEIKTPPWAAKVVGARYKGGKIVMGRTPAGNWLVQSVLVPKKAGAKRAKKIAQEVVNRLEKRSGRKSRRRSGRKSR